MSVNNSLIPLAVALITVIGGFIGYLYQRRWERKKDIEKAKREVYRDFFLALGSGVHIKYTTGKTELPEDFQGKMTELVLYASDPVVHAFEKLCIAADQGNYQEMQNCMDMLILEMRLDCLGGKTKVSIENLKNCKLSKWPLSV